MAGFFEISVLRSGSIRFVSPVTLLCCRTGVSILSVFLFTGFIRSVPLELEEAASIDGCGLYRTFYQIVMPLLKPSIATIAVLNIFNIWNDFLQPMMFITSRSKNTLVIQIYQFVGEYTNNWPLIFASICMIVVPVLIIFICAQKYVIGGITAGAVKE